MAQRRTSPFSAPCRLTVPATALALLLAVCTAQAASLRVVTGGVTEEQRRELQLAAADFSLQMTFSNTVGQYLADVTVRVRDSTGQPVVDVVTQGPLLLAALPSGQYTVEASYAGRVQQRRFSVPASGQARLAMQWPS